MKRNEKAHDRVRERETYIQREREIADKERGQVIDKENVRESRVNIPQTIIHFGPKGKLRQRNLLGKEKQKRSAWFKNKKMLKSDRGDCFNELFAFALDGANKI